MWQKLKELKFERASVILYRSSAAMEQWKVETEYRNGDTTCRKFDDQKSAYKYYLESARNELDHDAYQWSEEIRS